MFYRYYKYKKKKSISVSLLVTQTIEQTDTMKLRLSYIYELFSQGVKDSFV